MTRRSLLIVCETLIGGLGAAGLDQARWFSARGWRVTIAGPQQPPVPPAVTLRVVDIPTTARDAVRFGRAWQAIRRLVREQRPDVVHCHGMRAFAITRLASPVRPYVTLHSSGPISSDPRGYGTVRGAARALIPRLAKAAITAAPEFGGGWRFVPHASPRLASMTQHEFPSAGDTPLFLWIGRLEEPKEPILFVRAMAAVARTRPVRGLIAGSGVERERLEAAIRSEGAPVEVLGELEDIEELIARSWAVVLLSRFEGIPFAIEEAMWCGRAPIASALPGLSWLIGDAGELVTDLASATVAIARLADHSVAASLGTRAAERVRSRITADAPWPAVDALYRDHRD